MNKKTSLARLAPAVAAQFDQLQDIIRNLGEGIGVALAQKQEATEQQKPEPERAPVRQRLTKEPVIEASSPTRGYRARAVAERLSVHPQTLWRWIREGRFPKGVKVGPMVTLWTETTIEQWLAERAKAPEAADRD
jgi:prophage regulatory protein